MATAMNEEKWELPDNVNSDLFFYLLRFVRDFTGKPEDFEKENQNVPSYIANLRDNNKGINVNIFYCTKGEWDEISPKVSNAVEALNAYPKSKIGKTIRLHIMEDTNEPVPQNGNNELILLFIPFETFDVTSVEAMKTNKNLGIIPVLDRIGSYFGTWLTENKPTKWGGARIKYKIVHPTTFLFEDREKIVEETLSSVFNNINEDIGHGGPADVFSRLSGYVEQGPSGVVGVGDAIRIIGFKICDENALPPSIFQRLVQQLVNEYREAFGLDENERVPYDAVGLTQVAGELVPSQIVQNLKLRCNLHSSVLGDMMWTNDHGTGIFCFFEEMALDHGIDPWETIEDEKWRDLIGLEEWELQLALKYDLIEKN